MTLKPLLLGFGLSSIAFFSSASDFLRLDAALPTQIDAASIAPVFDFDTDGCFPAAGISRSGEQNGGLKPTGSLTGDCRTTDFLSESNTVHRYACTESNGATYCGHFYALYFEKDQVMAGIQSGHRHDWEHAAVWTVNNEVTHGSYSAHGKLITLPAAQLEFQQGHLKIVYHKDGGLTHALRFAKVNEIAENPYGTFVTPAIVSWYEQVGDNLENFVMRALLNNYDYGSANLPVRDSNFLSGLNTYKPAGYPTFTDADMLAANENGQENFVQLVNESSSLCLDISGGLMASGTNVLQWNCSNVKWQRWYFDAVTGLIHSQQDPRFCLDNGGNFQSGANIRIWRCDKNSNNQRFVFHADHSIGLIAAPEQVLDGYGMKAGDNVGLWQNWGGKNQRWIAR